MSPELKRQKEIISWLVDRPERADILEHFGLSSGMCFAAVPSWETLYAYLEEIGLIEEFEKEKSNDKH